MYNGSPVRLRGVGTEDVRVQPALDAGLFVIIDYHVIGPDGYYQPVPPEWGAPPDLYDSDFELATDFWDTVSTEIQDRRVMFELWNEPVYEEDELPPSDPHGVGDLRLRLPAGAQQEPCATLKTITLICRLPFAGVLFVTDVFRLFLG